jgi:hypothetical protein
VSKQLGPIEVCCDAPPYRIVRTSRDLGIRRPEDVRWLRLSAFQSRTPAPARGVVALVVRLFRGAPVHSGLNCTCGAAVPELSTSLVLIEGSESGSFRLGQCPRCRTVFWDFG